MSLFSERYGYVVKPMQFESMTPELRNRIWNVYTCEVCTDCVMQDSNYMEELMDLFGIIVKKVYEEDDIKDNLQVFQKWYMDANWYEVYDFIEAYLNFLPKKNRDEAIENFNAVLKWENAGYRIINGIVVPITNEEEIQSIECAQITEYESVNTHMLKAAQLFSQRPTPDFENSIKESISAVEAICRIITNDKKATLGDTLKKLENNGIKLHKSLQNAMSNLYGYTSDEGGIRHGSIIFAGASSEDAKYMLISCSAFVNYLIEKWEIVKSQIPV